MRGWFDCGAALGNGWLATGAAAGFAAVRAGSAAAGLGAVEAPALFSFGGDAATLGFLAAALLREPSPDFTGDGRDCRPRRCALPITALRLTPPSSSAIWLAVMPFSHMPLSWSIRSSVQDKIHSIISYSGFASANHTSYGCRIRQVQAFGLLSVLGLAHMRHSR